ncbi:MAG TPA: mechanosensitive ion channel [Gammaproteobacteria bacterium]|nr:mechanosensitive ion channel [Gammaproteobacteria bacterium]
MATPVVETNLVKNETVKMGESVVGWLTEPLFTLNGSAVTVSGLFRALLIFLFAVVLSRLLQRLLKKFSQNQKSINEAAVYTIGRVSHYFILTIGFFFAASSLGINLSNLAIIAGALGVGVGMGLQNIVNNFVSGLILLFERSLKVGDFIELSSGVMGTVREISIRSTLITTNDNVDIVIPNSEFISSSVTNWTMKDAHCRLRIPFGVAYGTDKELVRKAVLEAADRVKLHITKIPQRQPKVWLVNFGDSSLDFELVIWLTPKSVRHPEKVNAAYLWEIENSLSQYGIEIPFPQRDLHVRSWQVERPIAVSEAPAELQTKN